ncbi:MAG: adenylate/guanylate cyclase, partial [Phormidium sp. GEM2.Bin31]
MRDEDKPKEQLIQELTHLRQRVEALEIQQQQGAQQEPNESSLTDEMLQSQLEERTAALVEANDQLVAEIVKHTQAEQALRSAKEQLEAVLDAVPGVVSWISRDLRYLGVNHQLAQMFEAEPENFIGKDIGFLRASHDFQDFMMSFFESNADDATCEVSTRVHGELRDF